MSTPMTKYAPPGSMADRINKMSNANVNSDGMGSMKGAGSGGVKSTMGGGTMEKLSTNPKEMGPSATCMGEGKRGSKKY